MTTTPSSSPFPAPGPYGYEPAVPGQPVGAGEPAYATPGQPVVVDQAQLDAGNRPAVARVVPEGVDLVDDLTVQELDIASRQLGCDVMAAMQEGHQARWRAMALLAWLWAKRADTRAKLDPFLQLNAGGLLAALGFDDADEPAPAPQLSVEQELAANPTDAAPAS